MQRRDFFKAAALVPATVGGVGFASAATLGKQIKITGLETELRERLQPSGRVTYDAIHKFDGTGGGVVVRLLTDAGITGWGSSSFGMIGGAPRVLQTILEQEVKPVIVGKDPAFPKKIRADLWAALEYAGVQGVTQFAIAAIDIAVWDIIGKAAGQPVYKLIGGFRDRMPVYSMCGWYFDEKDNDLSIYKHVLDEAMQQGYQAVKIKVGRFSLDDDIKRIKIAQDTVGKDKRVLVDANQVFNRKEALRRGRVYQQMGCFWFEEPLPPYDVEGCAELAKELDIRIASGENLYTRFAFANWIEHRASDVVQPDNRRAGGLTEWMEIAAIADGFGIEVASHGGGATNLNMLLAMPNAIYMETSGPQANMVNGEVPGPQEPGMSTETRRGYPGREF
jgi:L-alanine-DL-glutamate epimerase-like enolase superfamily enzyme